MNDRLLTQARTCLIGARERLAMHRRLGQLNSNDHDLLAHAEQDFRDALDRAWELQCMTLGMSL